MEINTSLSAEENLIAQINFDNQGTGLQLDLSKVFFGIPVDRTPDQDPNNTTVDILPDPRSRYAGSASITYSRLGFDSNLDPDADFRLTISEAQTVESMMALAATYLGVVAGELVYSYGDPPETPGGPYWLGCSIKSDSLLYTPGDIEFRVIWPE